MKIQSLDWTLRSINTKLINNGIYRFQLSLTEKYSMNLNQITVPSLDLSKSIPFYEKLGLKLIVNALPHYARFECPDGSSTFSLHQTDELPSGHGISVYFECENLDHKVEILEKAGIVFDLAPTDQEWLWREAKLKDVDGNQLILYYAGKNRLDPPWRLKSE